MSSTQRSLLPSLIIGIVTGIVAATFYFHSTPAPEPPATTDSSDSAMAMPVAVAARTDRAFLLEDERNTIQVFEQVASSVVFIVNKSIKRDYFTRLAYETRQGTGSGFVWDKRGNIVTNFHVVQSGQSWEVTLNDNSTYEAELVGAEASKDIAVLRIKAPTSKLTPVRVGSSDDLRVGRKVIAIGNPFELDQTLTTGVVSALDREIQSVTRRTIQGVIQTDAAINPGNSGGPLLNSSGELIGMNTAIYSTSGSSAGIGFAVPVKIVMQVVPELIEYGKVIRPALGVYLLEDRTARRIGIDGVAIRSVVKGGAADRAGLQGFAEDIWGRARLGDIIIGINGKRISDYDELSNELEKYRVGDIVTVNYLRGDSRREASVKLQEM